MEATAQTSLQQRHTPTVSPNHQRSPCLDAKTFLQKEKRFPLMNIYTALDTPSQAFSPSGVLDFTQEGYIASCFGSSYGYDGSFATFEDSLLSPPDSSEYLTKFESISDSKGDICPGDYGGVFYRYGDDVNLDPKSLQESISLPDKQEGDVTFTPYTALTDFMLPIPPISLFTSPDSDIKEVLSNSSDPSNYPSEQYLPLGENFYSFEPPTASEFDSPALTPINSPNPSSSYYVQDWPLPSPCSSTATKDPLGKNGTTKSSQSQEPKRKAPTSLTKRALKPKHRLSMAAKKERKREQNKNAALHYRQRKKEEKNCSFLKLDDVEAKNFELRKKVSTMTEEIEYLKKLWSEVCAAKRLSQ